MRKVIQNQGSPQGEARPFLIPAPTGGWTTRAPEANMSLRFALLMENFVPRPGYLEPRKGTVNYSDAASSTLLDAFVYESAAPQFFLTQSDGIHQLVGTTPGALLMALTVGEGSFTNFTTVAGRFGIFVNGADELKLYDGAAWSSINAVSAPAITGVTTSTLKTVVGHKNRLWFTQTDTIDAYYLPVGQIGGVATVFPLGQTLKLGGKLHSIVNWSVDGGAGPDDYLCFFSTKGEVAIYQGSDPSSLSTWGLVGVYFISELLGRHPPIKQGGDLLLLTEQGIYPLTKALKSSILDRTESVSDSISEAFLKRAASYPDSASWQMLLFPQEGLLIVNVPTENGASVEQFVMNLTTKAWCKLTGWVATRFVLYNKGLFFLRNATLVHAFNGNNDLGVPITARLQQAFSLLNWGLRGKQISMLRPHIQAGDSLQIRYGFYSDYELATPLGSENIILSGDRFDMADFDAAYFADDYSNQKRWLDVNSSPGFAHSLYLEITTSAPNVKWIATDVISRPAGLIM